MEHERKPMKIDKLRKNDTAEMMHRQSDQNRGTLQACFFLYTIENDGRQGSEFATLQHVTRANRASQKNDSTCEKDPNALGTQNRHG